MTTNAESNNASPRNPNDDGSRDWRDCRQVWRRERREARRRSPLYGILPGMILLALGGVFLAVQTGALPEDNWWPWIPLSLGVVFLINATLHWVTHSARFTGLGFFIPGAVLTLIGVFSLVGIAAWWPVILLVAGAAVLVNVFLRNAGARDSRQS